MTPYKIMTSLILAGALVLGAVACAPGDGQGVEPTAAASPTATTQPTPTRSASPTETADNVKTIRVSVRDGEVSPPPDRVSVDVGQRVRIVVTSDQPDEVHVHGYDESVDLEPGEPAAVEFTANQPGLYEVETHESGMLLFQLAVRG